MPAPVQPPILRSQLLVLAALLLGTTLLAGCGCACGGIDAESNIPRWYLNTPADPNYLYAAHSAADEQMQVAIDTATARARQGLAASLDTKLESYTRAFTDTLDGRLSRQFSEVRQETVRTLVEKAAPTEKEVYKKEGEGTWRAFVLIEMPGAKAAQALLAELEGREELYTRFRESASYQEVTGAATETQERSQER